MAVPKRRTARSRGRMRRAHQALSRPRPVTCTNCGSATLPHRVCPNCGHFQGRFYVSDEES